MVDLWHNKLQKFDGLVYVRPDADFIEDLFASTRHLIREARSAEALIRVLDDFTDVWNKIGFMEALARIRAKLNQGDAYYTSEVQWLIKQHETNDVHLASLAKELSHRRLKKKSKNGLGLHVLLDASRLNATISRHVETELMREAQLVRQLDALSIATDGYSNPDHRHFAWDDAEGSSDGELRRRVYQEQAGVFTVTLQQRERLFDDLFTVRNRIAAKMGYRDYIEYSLVRHAIQRSEHGKRSEFRRLVKQHIVPLCRQIRRLQVERLNKNTLEPADYYRLMSEVWPDAKLGKNNTDILYQETVKALLGPPGDYLATLSTQGYINYDQDVAKELSTPTLYLPGTDAIYLNVGDERLSTFVPALFYASGVAVMERAYLYERRALFTRSTPLLLRALTGTTFMLRSVPTWERFLGRASGLALELDLTRRVLEIPLMCAVEAFEEGLYLNPEWGMSERGQHWHQVKRDFLPDEAEADHLSVMPYASDWLTLDQLVESPLRHTEQAMADIMVFATKPFSNKNHTSTLNHLLGHMLTNEMTGSALEAAMGAGYLSPFETNTMRMAAFSIALALGL